MGREERGEEWNGHVWGADLSMCRGQELRLEFDSG